MNVLNAITSVLFGVVDVLGHLAIYALVLIGIFYFGAIMGWRCRENQMKINAPDAYRALKAREVDEELAYIAKRESELPSMHVALLTFKRRILDDLSNLRR